jgi:uncharacterized protein
MENQPLGFEIRFKAALCHFLGLAWFPITVFLFLIKLLPQSDIGYAILSIALFPPLGLILANLIVLLLWIAYRKSHSFINLSGRCAINLLFSCNLYLFISLALAGITCGLTSFGTGMLPIASIFSSLAILVMPMVFLAHFVCVIIGVTCALQGKIYSYPLTIRFLQEQPAINND